MQQLVPAAFVMAGHPMPHCADPASLYPKLVNRIYTAGASARSAHGLSALQHAAAPLKDLNKIGHRLDTEISRTVGNQPVTASSSQPAGLKAGLVIHAAMGRRIASCHQPCFSLRAGVI